MALDLAQSAKSQPIPTQRSKHKDPLVKIVRVVDETVRRESALDFGGCNSRPATGALHRRTSRRLHSSSPAFAAFRKLHGLNSTLDLTKFARRRPSCWKISISTHSESWDSNTTNSESPFIDSRPSGFAMVTRASCPRESCDRAKTSHRANPGWG
jgi:hypothetical protein